MTIVFSKSDPSVIPLLYCIVATGGRDVPLLEHLYWLEGQVNPLTNGAVLGDHGKCVLKLLYADLSDILQTTVTGSSNDYLFAYAATLYTRLYLRYPCPPEQLYALLESLVEGKAGLDTFENIMTAASIYHLVLLTRGRCSPVERFNLFDDRFVPFEDIKAEVTAMDMAPFLIKICLDPKGNSDRPRLLPIVFDIMLDLTIVVLRGTLEADGRVQGEEYVFVRRTVGQTDWQFWKTEGSLNTNFQIVKSGASIGTFEVRCGDEATGASMLLHDQSRLYAYLEPLIRSQVEMAVAKMATENCEMMDLEYEEIKQRFGL